MHEHCMAFPSITGDKKGVNAQKKNTCTQMRIKTSLEAHKPETKLEPQQITSNQQKWKTNNFKQDYNVWTGISFFSNTSCRRPLKEKEVRSVDNYQRPCGRKRHYSNDKLNCPEHKLNRKIWRTREWPEFLRSWTEGETSRTEQS